MSHTPVTAMDIVRQLDMKPHPEGGWYRQSYVSKENFSQTSSTAYPAGRPYATSIYFLITEGNYSAFHRIRSDELWYHHSGSALNIELIHDNGHRETLVIGSVEQGLPPQAVVHSDTWFASHVPEDGEWALVGCSVAPGFTYDDFELGNRALLIREFPDHQVVITRFTRTD